MRARWTYSMGVFPGRCLESANEVARAHIHPGGEIHDGQITRALMLDHLLRFEDRPDRHAPFAC